MIFNHFYQASPIHRLRASDVAMAMLRLKQDHRMRMERNLVQTHQFANEGSRPGEECASQNITAN